MNIHVVFPNVKSILRDILPNEAVFHISVFEAYVNRLLSCHDIRIGQGEFDELIQQLTRIRGEAIFKPSLDRQQIINESAV